jgi:hypothetical protein
MSRWPSSYRITPADISRRRYDELRTSVTRAAQEPCIIQLRLPMWSPQHVRQLAASVASGPATGATMLLNADIDGTRCVRGLGVDCATLSPVGHTDTLPNVTPPGWQRFHGVAGIRGFWHRGSYSFHPAPTTKPNDQVAQ